MKNRDLVNLLNRAIAAMDDPPTMPVKEISDIVNELSDLVDELTDPPKTLGGAVEANGFKVLGYTRYTGVDTFLCVVLAVKEDGSEECCWIFNEQDGGLFWGHYGEKARPSYAERLEKYCGVKRGN